jgi:hypothetical protein
VVTGVVWDMLGIGAEVEGQTEAEIGVEVEH